MSEGIGMRLRFLRESAKLTLDDLSEKSGIHRDHIGRIERGESKNPQRETIIRLATALNVNEFDLVHGLYGMRLRNEIAPELLERNRPLNAIDAPSYIPNDVPIVGLAKAGPGGFFGENGLPVDEWSRKIHRPENVTDPHAYAIIIEGDSMEPMASNGDIFLCETNKKPKNGDRVVVQTHSDEVMAKLFYDDGKHIVLKSMNQKYEPVVLDRSEIRAVHVVRWVKYK